MATYIKIFSSNFENVKIRDKRFVRNAVTVFFCYDRAFILVRIVFLALCLVGLEAKLFPSVWLSFIFPSSL